MVRIYVTPFCGYCRAAERLLSLRGAEIQRIDVRGDRETRQWLREVTGQRTVPQIFIRDRSIGGFTELAALDRSGELQTLLAEKP